jgi:hypothetical protein
MEEQGHLKPMVSSFWSFHDFGVPRQNRMLEIESKVSFPTSPNSKSKLHLLRIFASRCGALPLSDGGCHAHGQLLGFGHSNNTHYLSSYPRGMALLLNRSVLLYG